MSSWSCLKKGFTVINNDYLLLLAITFLGSFISGFIPIIFMGPIFCGYSLCYQKYFNNEKVEFEDLFKGFNKFLDTLKVVAIFILTLPLLLLPAILIILPSLLLMATKSPESYSILCSISPSLCYEALSWSLNEVIVTTSIVIGIFFLMITSILLNVMLFFIFSLMMLNNLNPWESYVLSLKATLYNSGNIILLLIMLSTLSVIGILFCYVGFFLFLPIFYASLYILYNNIFIPKTV